MKATNSRQLAMRDPARAALFGILPGSRRGSDFGSHVGSEFGDEMGDEYGDEYGDDAGAEFGAPARRRGGVAPGPTQAQLVNAWHARQAEKQNTHRRRMKLNPNHGSEVQVECYAMPMSEIFTLGTAASFSTINGSPDVNLRPQHVTCNVPQPGLAIVAGIRVANVNVTVGPGVEDAWAYNANGVGRALDMPTLSPSNRATITGNFTTFIPIGYNIGDEFLLSFSLRGPATITA